MRLKISFDSFCIAWGIRRDSLNSQSIGKGIAKQRGEASNRSVMSHIAQRSRSNQCVHSPGFDKSGSFNTSTTSEETSIHEDFASPGNIVSNTNVATPSKKKSMMTMSVSSKSQKVPEISLGNEDSFKVSEDSSWWQSPKVTKDETIEETELNDISQLDRLPEPSSEGTTDKTNSGKKSSDKKKKVKRISMIKVKACDLGSLTAHQFTKTGDFATDQRELQKALMQWKAEQKSKTCSGTPPSDEDSPAEHKTRSKSKLRAKEEVESSEEHLHRRSRSTGRRSSDTEVVDLTAEDKRSKSVSRRSSDTPSSEKPRSRSVARKVSGKDEEEDACLSGTKDRRKADEKSEIRSRGRSVGAKRSTKESGEKSRGKSLVRTTSGKLTRERSRSVARQRPCEEIEDTSSERDVQNSRSNRGRSVPRTPSSDLELGLKKVDRDTRSRSVARQRPNDEDINSHSNSAHSLHSSRSKSTTKTEKTCDSVQSDQSGSIDSTERKRRSKSLIRKTRKLEENYCAPTRGRSNTDEATSSGDEGIGRTRSASVGAGIKKRSTANTDDAMDQGIQRGEPSHSKSIPWNEFLMHAQSTSCS